MKLNNSCSLAELVAYAQTVPFKDDNKAINCLYYELAKISKDPIDKRIISAIFQLLQHYHAENYIDIGCMILAILSQPKSLRHVVFLNIKKGTFGVMNGVNFQPDNKRINDICNNLKQIIVNVFISSSSSEV